MGQGAILYKYRMQEADLVRLKQIINMYGHRGNTLISNSHLRGGQYFNYIKGNFEVIGFPKWANEEIERQLSAGVRIWHTKPTKTKLIDGTN